jgi:hypothetical protein
LRRSTSSGAFIEAFVSACGVNFLRFHYWARAFIRALSSSPTGCFASMSLWCFFFRLSVKAEMECRFFVEAKAFAFSAKANVSKIHLEERRKRLYL